MKSKFLLSGLIMMVVPIIVWATPPESLDVAYDPDKGMITVSGRHSTQDRLEHFIRRFRVTVDQNEPHTTYLTRQDSVSEFRASIPIDVKSGGTVRVEVFCNQGGSKEFLLQIPQKAALNEVKVVENAQQLKELKDKDHQTLPIIP